MSLQLCGVEEFELLWERAEDTKVLLAWSRSHIVLSFRGTASWANVMADLQFWLTGRQLPRHQDRPPTL